MSSYRVLISASAVSMIVVASPLLGQSTGTFELGPSGSSVYFDSNLGLSDVFAPGLQLGFYILPRLSVEGEVQYATSDQGPTVEVKYYPIRARLLLGQPVLPRVELLLGGGFVQNHYDNYNGQGIVAQDYGATGLLGLRLRLGSSLVARVAGTADYIPKPINFESYSLNYGIGATLSFRFNPFAGGGPSGPIDVDRDRDGIVNQRDICPNTPAGTAVDGRGCPIPAELDADGDGVTDSDDACPDTRSGVAVDDRGCPEAAERPAPAPAAPADGDGDGVSDPDDACPDTPSGVRVDPRGCPVAADGDGDGVADPADACPDTPSGVRVDPRGCPVAADSDADGVADPNDRCPNTPSGVTVDARGCPPPSDADRDGVADPNDRCPDTPSGVEVDAQGCPPPPDADGDGVPDLDDACMNTPSGVAVDARGCPVRGEGDADGDGVADAEDRCPGTPSGEAVDDRGCGRLFEAGATKVILQEIEFTGEEGYQLTPASRGVLDEVAEWLKAHPDFPVEIAAHTDNREFRAYALIRSLGRASAVRKYLVSRGVAGERLLAKGYGPDEPVAGNDTAAGRARNERIELRRR